jgi:ureidoacrylate peracid hydrolase
MASLMNGRCRSVGLDCERSWTDSEALGISDRLVFAKNMRSDVPGLSSIRSLLIALTMLLAPMPLTMTWARQLPSARADVPDLDPRHTAVIVHEMINDFISAGGEYDKQGRRYSPELMAAVVPRIQKLLATARQKKIRVIYVRFTSHEDGSTLSDANRRDLISRGEAPEERTHIEGSWGWEIIDALKPQPQDLVLRKYRPDAFYGTILDSILRWNGIKTVVTTGVGVAVGGVPTVMTASNLGYQSVAVGDAFVSTDGKRTAAAIEYLGAHAIVRSHQEVVDAWERAAPRPDGVAMNAPGIPGGPPPRVMHEGREIPVSREALLGAPHCALVINDMQNDFLSPRGACARRRCGYDRARASAIVPPIEQVVRTARARGALVIFLQSTIAADDLAPSSTWPPSDAVREGTWGWRTIDSLKPQRGDIVIPKYRPDGFHGTRLDDVLRRRGIKTLVLAGVNADYGGLQTLMRGWYIGYYRVVLTDAVLSNTTEAAEFGQGMLDMAMPTTHRELINIWTRAAR